MHNRPEIRSNEIFSSDNPFLRKVTEIVRENIGNELFGVEELAREMSMSRFQLYRKLHALTGLSISRFIRELRLEKAGNLLVEGDETASEISYRVGFGSPAYFTKCFTRQYGLTPGEFRKTWQLNRKNSAKVPFNDGAHPLTGRNLTKRSHLYFIKRRLFSISLAVVVMLALIHFLIQWFQGNNDHSPDNELLASMYPDKSIAILHFTNQSGEEENRYFVEGVKEALLRHLSGIHDLRVVTRSAIEKYRNTEKSSLEIGNDLGVTYVIDGNIEKKEGEFRIQIMIVDILNGKEVLSRNYMVSADEILDLMSEIARDVTEELALTLKPGEEKLLSKQPTKDPMAYNLYMRAKMFYANYLSMFDKKDLERAEILYKDALKIDSSFALAYVGLGEQARPFFKEIFAQ